MKIEEIKESIQNQVREKIQERMMAAESESLNESVLNTVVRRIFGEWISDQEANRATKLINSSVKEMENIFKKANAQGYSEIEVFQKRTPFTRELERAQNEQQAIARWLRKIEADLKRDGVNSPVITPGIRAIRDTNSDELIQ